MRNKKDLLHTSLLEKDYVCIGIYRHVVVNTVLFLHMHAYSGGHNAQCMQAQRTNPMGHRGSIYRDKMYIQRSNHMGLWGHNACTKEQSYKDTRYLCVQRTNPPGIGCTNRGPIL